MDHSLDSPPPLCYNIRMKNETQLISQPINVAHLMSLAGMLREYAPEQMHFIFSAQILMQCKEQGIDVHGIEDSDYNSLLKKTVNFSIPANCIADISKLLLDAFDESVTADSDDHGKHSAFKFLISQWQPFALAALKTHTQGKFHPRNRLTDFGAEDLN
mgnify:CR=1 FL=1